jgi:hypothetical protein
MNKEESWQNRYIQRLQKGLDAMGNTHSLEDIVELIKDGHMQSFVFNETWAITQIVDFPRRRVMEIFLVAGDMKDAVPLHDQVLAYAREQGCEIVRCFGRDGWSKWAFPRGWTNGQRVYLKEL